MRALIIFSLVAAATAIPASNRNPMINEGFFEGDIAGIDPDQDRNAVPLDSQRWPNGVVPYVLDASVSHIKDLIQKSMRHIEQNSCIRFKQRTNEHNHIRIFYGNGCWSFWGLLNQGEQRVSLGDRCDYFGTVVHELLHALGFEHEHNRSDRDNYLNIHLENVDKEWHHAFKKLLPNENRLFTSFDFDSVMLYGEGSFAKTYGLKSMTAKDGRFMDEPYNKPGMSASDIKRLNMLYQCRK